MYLPVPPTSAIYTSNHHWFLPPDTTGVYYLCMNYQYLIVLNILFPSRPGMLPLAFVLIIVRLLLMTSLIHDPTLILFCSIDP